MAHSAPSLPPADAAHSGDGASAASRGLVVDAALSQLLGWCLLAIVNQTLIVALLPPVALQVRITHAAYDGGQLVALGLLSFAAVKLVHAALARAPERFRRFAPWRNAVLLALAVFAVAMLIVHDDVANFAERHELSPVLAGLGASAVFAFGLTSTLVLRRFLRGALRALPLLGGIGLAVVNAVILDGDYPAVHFMIAWCAALLIAQGLEGRRLPAVGRGVEVGGLVLLGGASAVTLAIAPGSTVLQRLYSLPSSVAAPFIARLLPQQGGPALDRVPARYRTSPWFENRSKAKAVAPSGAVKLSQPPIVFFFTIDALRADVLELSKYDKLLPELHKLKKTSAYFTQARAPTPATTTTMASVFAAKYYSQLRWSEEGDSMVQVWDDTVRFPALLSDAGVRTIHTATLGRLRASQGVGLGFTTEIFISKSRAADAIDKLIEEIDLDPNGPLFMYAHFVEPHAPYDLGGKSGSVFERYVREIAIVDKQIGRLRRHLREAGLERDAIFIVSADHGEAFGEHGTTFHAKTAYEELLRVPLIVHVPGLPGRRIDRPVTLMDVGPTLLDLFGLPTPGVFMGESLLPLVAGKDVELARPIAADTGRRHQVLYLDDGKKVIMNLKRRTVEVYDLKADPGELNNIAEQEDPAVEAAIETTKLFFSVHARQSSGDG